MQEVEQSTNPALTSPTVLDAEALKSVDVTNLDRLKAIYPKLADSQEPKKMGRPKGSKNKTTVEREATTVSSTTRDARTPTQRMMGTRAPSSGDKSDLTPQQKQANKAARTEEIADKISVSFNSNIAMVLGSMGMPTNFIYKPGREPKRVADSSPYTEFVGQILISPGQATIWAKFLTELEQTELAKKFSGTGEGNSNIALLSYGALSLLAGMQYIQGLNKFYSEMKPMLEQMKAMKEEQANRENRNGQ